MTTLLLAYRHTPVLLLELAGGRPLLLEYPAELRAAEEARVRAEQAAAAAASSAAMIERARVQRTERRWGEDVLPDAARPRAPEVQIDPRTVFKRRPSPVAAGPRQRGAEPAILVAAEQPVADYLIIPSNPTFRASEQGVKAVITYLRTAQILVAKAEQIRPEGTTVELLPDAFSHLAFTEGTAPQGPPSVLEGTLWFSSKPSPLPFGEPARTSCFRLEIIGARYPRLVEGFLMRLHQILHLRPEVVTTPHEPARLRGKSPRVAAEPIPRCDMQEV